MTKCRYLQRHKRYTFLESHRYGSRKSAEIQAPSESLLKELASLKRHFLLALAAAAMLLLSLPALRAQKPALTPSAPAAPASLEDRRKALNGLFHEYWEDRLKHDPEFASAHRRQALQRPDLRLLRQGRQRRAGARADLPDAAGGHRPHRLHRPGEDQPRPAACASLTKTRRPRSSRSGRCPSNQMDGIYTDYPQLVAELSFTTVKDYDDWIARLHAIPTAFDAGHRPTCRSAWKTTACRRNTCWKRLWTR